MGQMYTQGFHGWLLPRKGAILQFGIMAVTRPSRDDVYNAISSLEAENIANHLLDVESRSQIAVKMRKEAETFFSSISPQLPQRLTRNEFPHISVTALPPCHL
jgi:hypothetical protein